MTTTVTVPTDPPASPRTIAIAPPDDACPIAWATAVMLETAAMLLTRRPATVPSCEETGRLQCDTDPDMPMCVRCAIYVGRVYYGNLCRQTYKAGPLAVAGQQAQAAGSTVLELQPAPANVPALLLNQARIWVTRACDTDSA